MCVCVCVFRTLCMVVFGERLAVCYQFFVLYLEDVDEVVVVVVVVVVVTVVVYWMVLVLVVLDFLQRISARLGAESETSTNYEHSFNQQNGGPREGATHGQSQESAGGCDDDNPGVRQRQPSSARRQSSPSRPSPQREYSVEQQEAVKRSVTHIQTHICTHTNTHMYTHTNTHMYTHKHTYVHTYKHTYVHTQTHKCTHTQTHIQTHTNTYMYTHKHTYVHTQTHVHTHKHINVHTQTHICTHTNTYMYTHKHIYVPQETTVFGGRQKLTYAMKLRLEK